MTPFRTACLVLLVLAPAARAADIDPRLPADSEWVLHVNVKQVLEAPAVKKYAQEQVRSGLGQIAPLTRPVTALGIDPARDVAAVTIAGAGLLQLDRALVIVHGRFDLDKVHAAADKLIKLPSASWKVQQVGGVRVYEVRDTDRPGTTYMAFADKNTAVLSQGKQYVQDAAAGAGKAAKISKELRALVEIADGKDGLWLAALPPERVKKLLANTPQTAPVADQVRAFTGSLAVDTDLRVAFRVHTRDGKAAEEVTQLLEAAKGFAALAVQGVDGVGPVLAELLDACKISADKTSASLAGRLSEEQIARHFKKR